MSRNSNIQDVARLAEVSTSTVSNVVNGRHERMRPETLARVVSAMEELGYSPSASARQLKSGHSHTIGLIVPTVANPFWGIVARNIERVAHTFGYQVLLCNAERNPLRERQYAETLWANGVHGVIFGSSPATFEHISSLIKRGLAVIEFDRKDRRAENVLASSVGIDYVQGVHQATRHLIDQGHRRIGFLSGPIHTVSRSSRLDGYRSALESARIDVDADLVWQGSAISAFGDLEGAELGRAGARKLLTLPERPTAIIAINDMYAIGAYAGASDLGLRIPESLSVVGFDDLPIADVVQPSLTTLQLPLDAMAQAAVTTLIGFLEGTPFESVESLQITPQLIERASTAPPMAQTAVTAPANTHSSPGS